MQKILIGLLFMAIIGCGQNEFCGESFQDKEIQNLNGNVEGEGFKIGLQLTFSVAQKIGDKIKPQFEINYSVKDTLVINIIDIPDEITARKISCIVAENDLIKNTQFVCVNFNWPENSRSYKY